MMLELVYDYAKREGIMPKATVNTQTTERHDLKTCDGGFVELRRMSYGEFLKRRDMVSEMGFKGSGKDAEATMKMANEVVARYEFQTCIVDHNLEDENEKPLDFRSARAFSILDPRIGEEISSYIDKMNKWDEDEDGPLGISED